MAVRILAVSTDALVVLVRRTVLKESIFTRVRKKIGFWDRRRLTLEKAYEPITGNFSFALMASCIGMMVIFAVVMYFNLRS